MAIIAGGTSTSSMTHTGCVRHHNEDALITIPTSGIWAVADGMGGHDAGDYASRCIVSHLYDAAQHYKGHELINEIPNVIQRANSELLDYAHSQSDEAIIGTTVVVLLLEGDHYHCYWTGDSRCYLSREGELQAITTDHTEAEELIAQGLTNEAAALDMRTANTLTQAVGVFPKAYVDYVSDLIYEGDRFLLCTDGLTKVYSDQELAQMVSYHNIDEINQQFLTGAIEAGAPDNLSSVIVSL
ncbi:protein phosphatase 2C domain-containing protein [Aurantivibrio plasticivorans]